VDYSPCAIIQNVKKPDAVQNGKAAGPLVLVEWTDDYGCSPRWENMDGELSPRVMMCKSVGWLVHNDKDCKLIVPHLSEEPGFGLPRQGCGDMTIPTQSILRIIKLKEVHYGKDRHHGRRSTRPGRVNKT